MEVLASQAREKVHWRPQKLVDNPSAGKNLENAITVTTMANGAINLPIGKQVSIPGHFDVPVVLEAVRPIGKGSRQDRGAV